MKIYKVYCGLMMASFVISACIELAEVGRIAAEPIKEKIDMWNEKHKQKMIQKEFERICKDALK